MLPTLKCLPTSRRKGTTSRRESQEGPDLRPETARVDGDLLRGAERPFARLARRIADETRSAADEHDRAMTGQLEAPERQQGHETADVQAVRGRIKAHVDRPRGPGQMRAELSRRGDVRHESALLEILQHWHGHGQHPQPERALSHAALPARPMAPV
jgi:hypothetical protein